MLRDMCCVRAQVLSKLRDVLERHHALLLSVFASYALVLHNKEGPEPGLLLPRAAWTALVEDCKCVRA